jgi:hypothetical protein
MLLLPPAGQNELGPRLPHEFCESPSLQQTLQQLWLYNNHIKELPPNFSKMVRPTIAWLMALG